MPSRSSLAAVSLQAQVTFDRILRADREPQNWLSLFGHARSISATARSRRSRRPTRRTCSCSGSGRRARSRSSRRRRSSSTACSTPCRRRTTSSRSTPPPAACSGRIRYQPAPEARTCCGRVNRGLAILGDTLYMGTIDAHLLAIDAKSGSLIWNTTVASAAQRYSITHVAARREGQGDRRHRRRRHGPIRGIIAAFDAKTGKEVWRFYTIPGPGEPGNDTWSGDSWKTGGAGVWNAGAYDPETNLTFCGTGNPAPDWDGRSRARRQPVQRQRRRARRRHRQAEVALPVHAARRARLRLDAGAGARRHHVPRAAAQGDAVGESQRPDVRARSRRPASSCTGKPYVKVNWMDGFDTRAGRSAFRARFRRRKAR